MKEVINLPYAYDDLEPDINEETVDIHYNKHHKNYAKKLNEYLKKSNYDYKYKLEEIPKHIDEFPLIYRGDILYNAGGVLNHNLYWESLSKSKNMPNGKLLEKINNKYGSFENFRKSFNETAKYLVGSGYTFLVANKNGDLNIVNMVNQETPISYDFIPLFTIDLWEHAYYLQYKNEKNKYIDAFWNKANFDNASKVYNELF